MPDLVYNMRRTCSQLRKTARVSLPLYSASIGGIIRRMDEIEQKQKSRPSPSSKCNQGFRGSIKMGVNRNYYTSNNDLSCEKMCRYTFACLVFTLLLWSCEIQAQQEEGDSCDLTNGGTGKCKILEKCQSAYDELLAGNPPDTLCGFSGYDPIICCPLTGLDEPTLKPTSPTTSTSTETTSTEPRTTERLPNIVNRNPGNLARQKCGEYAQSVYALVDPPTLTIFRKKINISLCAIKSKKLIVGGTKADPMEFPHMAAVDDARPQDRRIIERIRHPDYKLPSEYHDIALLKLESSVTFDAYTRPACLAASRFEDSAYIATGWGAVEWGEDLSNDLLKATLNTVSGQSCNNSFSNGGLDRAVPRGIIADWQICAGEEGKDTCQGDSGGPLMKYSEDYQCMYDVVGITNIGRFCGSVVPGVYTRLFNYVSWLENTIWES